MSIVKRWFKNGLDMKKTSSSWSVTKGDVGATLLPKIGSSGAPICVDSPSFATHPVAGTPTQIKRGNWLDVVA